MNRKISKLLIFMLLLSGYESIAGFRDPVASTSDRSQEIQTIRTSTVHSKSAGSALDQNKSPAASKNNFPANNRDTASLLNSAYGPQPPANYNPNKAANNFSNTKNGSSPKWNAPIPKSPSLPGKDSIDLGELHVPGYEKTVTIFRDTMAPIQVKQRSNAQLHNFSQQARKQLLPTREYSDKPRSPEILNKYSFAFQPKPHQVIRTPIRLSLEKISKIIAPPATTQYENMVKRLDALFDGIYFEYPKGIAALWNLSELESNTKKLQARDALFAGILSKRNGWEVTSSNLFTNAVGKKLDSEERYVQILFKELENFESISPIDRVIEKVNPVKVKMYAPMGDKANYAMARRVLNGKMNPTLQSATFQEKITSKLLKEKIDLIRSVASLRNKDTNQDSSLSVLANLEKNGEAEVQQEARLALARALMRNGNANESLALYQNVTKTRENRLEVLVEQSYAEYKNGLYHDSLGKSVGLQSPYFQFGFAPDIHLVEILSRKALCDFGGAEAGVAKFHETYTKEAAALQDLLAKVPNTKDFYPELISYHGKTHPNKFERFLLRLPNVMENQKTMNSAKQEFEQLKLVGTKSYSAPRPSNWNNFTEKMSKEWSQRAKVLQNDSAKASLAEAEYMLKKLKSTMAQLELLDLDISTAAAKNYNVQSALNFPVRKLAEVKVEEDRFHWPFENEVWEDELDFLKMKNPSKCASAYLPESKSTEEN
jgi:hypothetical protein